MIKGVTRVFQGSFKKTFKVLQESFMCMALIAASRAEGGLVPLKERIFLVTGDKFPVISQEETFNVQEINFL